MHHGAASRARWCGLRQDARAHVPHRAHDVDATNFGYAPGEVPGLGTLSFAADAGLREKAVRAARSVAPGVSVWEGRVACGDQFVRTVEAKERIRSVFDATCCEMEGTAIAQTA